MMPIDIYRIGDRLLALPDNHCVISDHDCGLVRNHKFYSGRPVTVS